jgi:hypothetical protein
VEFGPAGSGVVSSAAGICPVMTAIELCSWPATTDSRPMNSGRFLRAFRYSMIGYWNSWIDCHLHMLRFAPEPETSPFGVTPEFTQVVWGLRPEMNG